MNNTDKGFSLQKTPIRVLILEDNSTDAEIAVKELERSGYDVSWTRVSDEKDFVAELNNNYDVILSDYFMGQFDGFRALEILNEMGSVIPFILVSGTVGEEIAVEAMRRGAVDYLLKDRMSRLGASVRHAIQHNVLEQQRQEAELKLAASERRKAGILRSALDAIVTIDEQGLIVEFNPAAEIMFGYTTADVIGQAMADLIIPPSLRDRHKNGWANFQRTGKSDMFGHMLEFAAMRSDGSEFPVEFSIVEVEIDDRHNYSAFLRDISNRKKAEQELKSAEQKYRHLIEQLPAVTYLDEIDNDTEAGYFRNIYMSPQVSDMLGYPAKQFSDDPHLWTRQIHPEDIEMVIRYTTEFLETEESFDLEHRMVRSDGTVIWVRDRAVRFRDDAAGKSFVQGIVFDITREYNAREQIRSLNEDLEDRVNERTSELNRAMLDLEKAVRIKDEFLASMSHELRTPLNSIIGLSESLLEQRIAPLSDKQLQYIHIISDSGNHLLELINDILDIAKIESGQAVLEHDLVDLKMLAQSANRMVEPLARKKKQTLEMEIGENVHTLWADQRRLKQMVVNLLSNGVKFTPEGGRIGLKIHADHRANKISIIVWDTGIGIKKEDLDRLFQPFVQLDSKLSRESAGTGLGLALVSQLARLHGGSVSVESEVNIGSRFIIDLPWDQASALKEPVNKKNTGSLGPIDEMNRNGTILLIEDTETVIMLIRDYLEHHQFKVEVASNGSDGVELARQLKPDIILMDVQMPVMSGLEATKMIREIPELKDTPIVALTALAMPGDREKCMAAGMNEYLSKPLNMKDLVKMINRLLGT